MGIIDSLSAGYRTLSRRPWLMLIPILLDLFLWWAPQLSMAGPLRELGMLFVQTAAMPGMPPDFVELSTQARGIVETLGENANLYTQLANTSLLHVPSLMAGLGGGVQERRVEVENATTVLGLLLVFGVFGVLIGTLYLEMLAQDLPIGSGDKAGSGRAFVVRTLRHSLLILLFVVLVGLTLTAIYLPLSFGASLLSLFSPTLGSLLIVVMLALTVVLFFYLYFVPVAVVMDDLSLRSAVPHSVQLVRSTFWPTLGFILLTSLIGGGFLLILVWVASLNMLGLLLAIPVNAFIGTGLALALLVFYRTRVLRIAEERAMLPHP